MAVYETIIILDSLMAPKEIDAAVERFSGIITENKGKVLTVDKWGKRRLAYEIKKKQYGFYVAIVFEAEGNIPNELESEFNYNDKVMRFLTYRFNKHKLRIWEEENKSKAAASASQPEPETKEASQPEPAAVPVAVPEAKPEPVETETTIEAESETEAPVEAETAEPETEETQEETADEADGKEEGKE